MTTTAQPGATVRQLRAALPALRAEQAQKRERLITIAEVRQRVSRSTSWVYAAMAKGSFPKCTRYPGSTSVFWRESDIDAWIEGAAAGQESAS